MAIYRVPLRRVFKAKHSPGDLTWDQVYGKKRCVNCHQPFKEGDVYRIEKGGKGFQHVECPPKPKKEKKP